MERESFVYLPRFMTESVNFTGESRPYLRSGLFMISGCLNDDASTPSIS